MNSAKILIVEDENAAAANTRSLLLRIGYEVVGITPSGYLAVQATTEHQPDVILLASNLKQHNKSEITAQLILDKCDIPIIYLNDTANETTIDTENTFRPYGCIYPPIQEHDLRLTIEIALHKHRINRENAARQQQLTAILQSVQNAVIITDPVGTIQQMNPLAEIGTGWEKRDAVGHPLDTVFTLLHPATEQQTMDLGRKIRKQEIAEYSDRAILLAKDTTKTPIDITVTPIKNEWTAVTGYVVLFYNSIQQHQAQPTEHPRTHHLNSFIESAGIGIQRLDNNGIITWANQAAPDIIGCSKQEYIGYPFVQFCLHPEELQEILTLPHNPTRQLQTNYEIRLRHQNGSTRYVLISATPLIAATGEIVYTRLFMQDITQHKTVQSALAQSESNYREIFENAHDSVVVFSPVTERILEANPSACALYGFTRNELIGKSMVQLLVSPEYCRQKIEETAIKGIPSKIESRQYRKDGSTMQLEVNLSLIHYNGQPAIISIGRDATERKQIEEALLQSEERYRTIVENQSDFIVQWLPDGTRIFVNESYCRYFNCTLKDVLQTSFFPFVPPQDVLAIQEKIAGLTPSSPFTTGEHRNIAPNGSTRWAHWLDQGIFNQEGVLTEVLSVGRDITEKKETDIAFRASEKRYRQVVENAGDCIYTTDKSGFFTYANPASLQMSGYTEEEILQRRYLDLVAPEYRKKLSLLYTRQFLERRPSMYAEFPFITRSGTIEWFGQTSTLIIENDELIGFHVIGHSINEHRRTEEVLRHSRNQIRSILEASPFPLVLTRMSDQTLLYTNRRAIELFDFSPSKSVGYPIQDFYVDRNAKRHLLKTVTRHNHIEDYEVELRGKNGVPFWALLSAQLLEYDGEAALLVACNNITTRKQAENEVRRLNTTLEERVEMRTEQLTLLNKEKDEILAIVAHDLKNPLAGIFMCADLLHRYNSQMSTEALQQQVSLILEASSRMEHIISNLLNINALEAGTLHLDQQNISLEVIFEELLPQYLLKAAKKNIAIQSGIHGTASLHADKTAVGQILDNLLSNAIKFSPHGSTVHLQVRATEESVFLEVQDEGPGFEPEDMQKIFRKFTRLSAKPTGGEHSTGLGLSIVKKLTEAMHGTVRCESKPGLGAKFIVELPKEHVME